MQCHLGWVAPKRGRSSFHHPGLAVPDTVGLGMKILPPRRYLGLSSLEECCGTVCLQRALVNVSDMRWRIYALDKKVMNGDRNEQEQSSKAPRELCTLLLSVGWQGPAPRHGPGRVL